MAVLINTQLCRTVVSLQILRVMRLARLLKMLRMMRASRLFKKWESTWEINYNSLALIKFSAIVVSMSHWLACAWHMTLAIAPIFHEDDTNWVEVYSDTSEGAGVADKVSSRYIASLYWSGPALLLVNCGSYYYIYSKFGVFRPSGIIIT